MRNGPNVAAQRAMILQQQRRYGDAEQQWRQALVADPHDAFAHAMLALCLAEREAWPEAAFEAQQAIGLQPDSPTGHYAFAHIQYRRDRFDEAEAAIRQAIQIDPYDADHFSLLAAIRFEQRRWPGALEAAEEGLKLDPEHVQLNNLRAMALVKLGRRAEAGATIGAALSRNPDSAVTHANQGWALLHGGDHKKALEHFREALRLDPESEWAKAGVVEALKASFFLYRWLLQFMLWMARLSSGAQWGIIIGAWMGNQVIRNIVRTNPELGPVLWPVLIAYFVFVVLTWIAAPLFNLLLRLHPVGKYALSDEQRVAANWVGVLLFVCVASFLARLATGREALGTLAIVSGLLTFPVSAIWGCAKGWPRWTMLGGTLLLALIGAGAVWLAFAKLRGAGGFLGLFVLGILVSTFAANALRMARPRK